MYSDLTIYDRILARLFKRLYRYIEIKLIVWYERNFDGIQRKQFKSSELMFKFVLTLCLVFYGVTTIYRGLYVGKQIQPLVSSEFVNAKEELPTPTEKQMTIAEVLDYIHMQESTRGKATNGHNVYCESIGKSNEYGYSPFNQYCFNSYEESIIYLSGYVQNLIDNYGLNGALCIYNTGSTKNGQCEYINNL